MEGRKHRVLVVSGRLLMAQGLVSLLSSAPDIESVEVTQDIYEALVSARLDMPDVVLLDSPPGSDYFVDRPVSIDGQEIKTIVLQEGDRNGQARLYMHTPSVIANLQNLLAAIMSSAGYEPGEAEVVSTVPALRGESAHLAGIGPAVPVEAQPSSLIKASASGPSRSRMSSSKAEV